MGFEIGKITRLRLGYVGENASRVIEMDVSEWLRRWPDALIAITVQRPTEDDLYIASTEVEGDTLRWVISNSDVAIAGKGLAQVRALDAKAGTCYVSRVVETIIEPSMRGTTDTSAPDKAAGWVNDVLGAADELKDLSDRVNEFLDFDVQATTLPSGSNATASYAGGVLTLGLPRGPKGDRGSAGPVTVNGIEGIGDNITLTGENIPLSAEDGTKVSAAVLQRDRVVSLLGNGYFPSSAVVNQRGWSSGTEAAAGQYFIDRWLAASSGAVTPTLTSNGITATGEFFQIVPKSGLVGKMVTAAIGLSDGTVLAKSGIVPADGTWINFINTSVRGTNLLLTNVSEDMMRFRIIPGENTVRWAALYEGAYSPSTVPAFQPKGYADELLDCQRYYYKVPKHNGIVYPGYSGSTTEARATIYVPVVMRVNPSITVEDMTQLKVYDAAGSHDVTAAAINYRDGNAVGVRFTTADLTSSRPCVVRLNTTVALVADFEP